MKSIHEEISAAPKGIAESRLIGLLLKYFCWAPAGPYKCASPQTLALSRKRLSVGPRFNRANAVIDGALQSIRERSVGLEQRKQSALVPIPRTTCSLNARMPPGGRNFKRVRKAWKGMALGQAHSVPNLIYHQCGDCGEQAFNRDYRKPQRRSA